MSNQGHWVGLKADTKNYFGFIYIIRDKTTGRAYIGKKQFYLAKPGAKKCRSKVADRKSPRWKASCWRESDWRAYKGSSNSLAKFMKKNPDHEYEYEIIKLCRSRGVLTYSETQIQWERDVLGTQMECGEFRYFNLMIGAIKFRQPLFLSDEHKDNIRKGHVGVIHTPEWNKAVSEGLKGMVASDSAKVNLAISHGKLTEDMVREIVVLLRSGDFTGAEISRKFNIGQSVISNIKTGKIWKHITIGESKDE